MMARRCRIVHVVYSFSIGGLENVIVQLINGLPGDEFEHVVLSLTHVSDFKDRVARDDVRFIALDKAPGHAFPLYPRIYALLRELKPDVLHTCNLAAMELVPLGWLAGVPRRIQAEHGWDSHDPQGTNARYRRLRKIYKPFISHYVAVSQDIDNYLARSVGVPAARRSLIGNGVDTEFFSPLEKREALVADCPFSAGKHWLIGTVGRLQTVKNQPLLARAFVRLLNMHPEAADRLRLVIIGEGPLRGEIEQVLSDAGYAHLAWLPGARNDVSDLLKRFDCFALPSQTEGTSCTLQEAMATALPVVATAVGGNPALIEDGVTGLLVPPDDEESLADALWHQFQHPEEAMKQGQMARKMAVERFSLESMVARYRALFLAPRESLGR